MKTARISAVICALTLTCCGMLTAAPAAGTVLTAYAADSETSGRIGENLTWTLDEEGLLTVSGEGEWSNTDILPKDIKKKITSAVVCEGITTIGFRAFEDCSNMTTVTLPDSLTRITTCAFYTCDALESVVIPEKVTTIMPEAFYHCSRLKEISFPESLRSIEEEALIGTRWLEDQRSRLDGSPLIINQILVEWEKAEGDVVISDSITSIAGGAFCNCTKMTSVTIPESVTEIGSYAFESCNGLTAVTIPDSITEIREHTFSGCKNLADVTLPESVTKIGGAAFANTAWLKAKQEEDPLVIVNHILIDGRNAAGDIVIPDGVTAITRFVFFDNSDLTSVTFPDSLTAIDSVAFFNTHLESVTLPASVSFIGLDAFGNCPLTDVTILNPQCEFYSNAQTLFGSSSGFTGVIHGYENSTAQTYAEMWGFRFESLGKAPAAERDPDMNGDGKITAADAQAVRLHSQIR